MPREAFISRTATRCSTLRTHRAPRRYPGSYVMWRSATPERAWTRPRSRASSSLFHDQGKGQGTGLGLSTVFGIDRVVIAGVCLVYSEVGRGTTFRVYFPQTERPIETLTPPPSPRRSVERRPFCSSKTRSRSGSCCERLLRRLGYNLLETQMAGKLFFSAKNTGEDSTCS